MIGYIRGGKTITFNSPNPTAFFGEYKVSQLRGIAAGWRVPYEALSGDLSEVSFSSGRMGLIDFRRFITSIQNNLLLPTFLEPVWAWFCEAAFLKGLIDTPNVPVKWSFPEFEYISPSDEMSANKDAVRNGFKSWQQVVAGMGLDPDETWEEIKEFQRRCETDGISLDSNPDSVSGRGVAQKAPVPTKGSKKDKKKGSKKESKKKSKQAAQLNNL
jgi:capsid protein